MSTTPPTAASTSTTVSARERVGQVPECADACWFVGHLVADFARRRGLPLDVARAEVGLDVATVSPWR